MDDEAVISTNDDASGCKRNAVQLGYWKDDYISYLIKQTHKRPPEINRGYFARVKGVEKFIFKFLDRCGENAQLINLGAGFDTLYWRLRDQNINISSFVDIDFPSVTAKKCYMIKRNKKLLERIHDQDDEVKLSSTDMHAGSYHCMGVDLRNVNELEAKLQQAEVKYNVPTLFIAECVLVYIENSCVDRLLQFIAAKFPNALFVNYEMCNMNDTFGNVMLENLRARGCNLSGIVNCRSLESQEAHFLSNNWTGAKAWDMVKIYYSIPQADREKIEKIEFLDEQELLIQLFQHYCICIGYIGSQFDDISFEDWARMRAR